MTHNFTKKLISYMALVCLCLCSSIDTKSAILTTQTGMSSSLINDIYQSSDGIIWIATEDGLNRYDGVKCQIYRNDINDSTSIVDSYILTVFESQEHDMFVGTQHGISKYDRERDCFEKIPLVASKGNQEVFAYVSSIIELSNGTIYIATSGHGLFEYDKKNNTAKQLDLKIGYYIHKLFKDRQNNIWIATNDNGISRISDNGFVYTVNSKENTINNFCEDEEGNIYASSLITGLYVHHNDTETFEHISCSADMNIKAIKNYNGKILIGTDGAGIYSYDTKNHTLERFSILSLPFDSNKIKVHSILIDNSGNIWLALFQKGVVFIPTCNNDFKYIGYKSAVNNYIGSNYISSVHYSDSTLYIGTDNDGLYVINYKDNTHTHYDETKGGPSTIMCMNNDNEGNIWIGTYLEGLYLLDSHTKKCSKVINKGDIQFAEESINSITTDHKRYIWIGSMGGGLTRYDQKEKKTYKYPTKGGLEYRENLDMLHNRWINCILYSEKNSRLYLGSLDGLGCLDLKTDSFTSVFGRNRIMAQCRITDLTEDMSGDLWIVSNLGLSRLSCLTNELTTVSENISLAHENIKSIECDNEGYIWGSTNNGLFRVDPQTLETINYYEQDGIVTSEFSTKSSCCSNDGRLFFGGTDGLTYFSPSNIYTSHQKPEIKLSDFYIKGQRVLPSTLSDESPVISYSMSDSTVVYNLSHTDNTFTIELSTKQLIPQQRISYIYTLTQGHNDPEHAEETGPGINKITFRDLKPDSYTINVVANNNGNLSEPYTINVNIRPAVYATTFAKLLYLAAIIIIIALISKQYYIKKKTKEKLIETLHNQEVHAAKMEMFTNIAHEIRTPMSLVVAPLKELMATDKEPQHRANYEVMERNTQRILRLMTQVLDMEKIDAGKMTLHFCPTDVNKIVNDVCLTFNFEARAKGIELLCNTNESRNTLVFVDHQHFDQIVTNLVSNAIKYTPNGGNVTVTTKIENDNYKLTVEDSGQGFSDDDLKHIFERFHRMNSNTIGFGIGLDLTNTIVKLHHGTITAGNRENNGGGIMTVCIPLGTEHLKGENITYEAQQEEADTNESKDIKKPKTGLKIVIADDDSEIREYIKEHLSDMYTVTTCIDGREALDSILANIPDLVVTDVVMPNMDGFTLCKNIKHNININHIPVVILTAKSAETDRIESYESGADAYLAKPFSIDELQATIKNLILQRQKIMANMVAQQQIIETTNKFNAAEDELSYNEKLLKKVTQAVNDNISNSEYSIEDLAKEIGISRVHLHRKMKEITNMTTRDFVRNIRLNYAAKLLQENRLDIKQIADMTGFTSPTYFTTAFRVFFGQTPKEYMNNKTKTK